MDASLRSALDALARADRLDIGVGPPPAIDEPALEARLRAAGAEGLDALERIAREGSPTGRVWAVSLLRSLDEARARPHLVRMLSDLTPIEVNTCLVGFRRTADWAASQLQAAPPPARPDPVEKRARWLAVGFVVAFALGAVLLGWALRRWG